MDTDFNPFFERGKCPHNRIERCPLYHAAHVAELAHLGCVRDLAEPCLVEKGGDYKMMVEALRCADPRLVAIIEFRGAAEESREQRQRNIRAAGIQ